MKTRKTLSRTVMLESHRVLQTRNMHACCLRGCKLCGARQDWDADDQEDVAECVIEHARNPVETGTTVWEAPEGGKGLPALPANLHHYVPGDVLQSLLQAHRRFQAATALVAEPPPVAGFHITLASGCYKRGFQLRLTLGANLTQLWPHRLYASLVVSVVVDPDGEHRGVLADIQRDFSTFMRPFPDHNGICGPLLSVVVAQPPEPFYHASYSKNTAHQAAIQAKPAHAQQGLHVIVNCDIDNIIGSEFIKSVVDNFLPKRTKAWPRGEGGAQ